MGAFIDRKRKKQAKLCNSLSVEVNPDSDMGCGLQDMHAEIIVVVQESACGGTET